MKLFKQVLSLLLLTLILFTHTASANEQYKLETVPHAVFLGWTNSNRADNNHM